MTELINLLVYSKYIAMNTSNAGIVSWSSNKDILFYKGLAIPLSSFRLMVYTNIESAETLFWHELIWIQEYSSRFAIDLDSIVDNMTDKNRGASCLRYDSAGRDEVRRYMFDWMLKQKGKRLIY